jgi:ATP-dependent DNA helicase RecQ
MPQAEADERRKILPEGRKPRAAKGRDTSPTELNPKGEKKEKGQTQEESYRLYREGLSISEIAAVRSLAHTTIEGHLARYVQSGDIPVDRFVDPVKLNQILTAARTIETDQLSPIKQLLGDEFSYTDIRFAVAYAKRLEDK